MAGILSVQGLLGLSVEEPQPKHSTRSRKVIAVVGTVNSDTTLIVKRVPDAGESVRAQDYKQSCGGKGANAAIASFRSCHRRVQKEEAGFEDSKPFEFITAYDNGEDIDVRLVAAIGDDGNGKICRANLQDNGIDISGVREITGSITGMSFCVVEEDGGQNRIMSHRGANDLHEVEFYKNPDNFLSGVDLLISHLAIPLKIVEQVLETAGKANVEIVLNAAPAQSFYRRLWKYLTHLIVNETEAGILSGRETKDVTVKNCPEIAELFLRKGAKNVVITLGEQGAYYATKDVNRKTVEGHVVAHKVDVKDTTGAGDTFVGAYASNYLHQKLQNRWDIREAVERASSASAWTIGEIGAQAAIPWADQIDGLQAKLDAQEETNSAREEMNLVHEGTNPAQEEMTLAAPNLALE